LGGDGAVNSGNIGLDLNKKVIFSDKKDIIIPDYVATKSVASQ